MVEMIDDFADAMSNRGQSSDYYRTNRNASNPINDIKIGKYGELGACLYLRELGYPKILPDFDVREGWGKGWDADLPFAEVDSRYPNVHVKTSDLKSSEYVQRNSSSEYSWTFQYGNKTGPGGRDDLFKTPDSEELVAFVYVPEYGAKEVKIHTLAPWNKVFPILKDPISPKLKGLKLCAYSDDLKGLA